MAHDRCADSSAGWILPFITPDDPAKVVAVISEAANVPVGDSDSVVP